MKREEFLGVVKEVFGDKVVIEQLKISDEVAQKLRVNPEDVRAYPAQAWVIEHRCPHCNHVLGGLFGSFAWGLQHGVGYCSKCEKVQFRYYHYVTEKEEFNGVWKKSPRRRIELFAVCGFSQELVEEE